MSPTQNPTPTNNMNMTFTDIPLRQPQPAQLRALQTTQPPPFQSMGMFFFLSPPRIIY